MLGSSRSHIMIRRGSTIKVRKVIAENAIWTSDECCNAFLSYLISYGLGVIVSPYTSHSFSMHP